MADEIASGSVQAWHEFVDRFSRLIFSVLHQVLFAEDEDEIRTVYVDILADLYTDKLRKFEGRSTLSTWLVLVSRATALDYLRKKKGRRRLPRGYEALSDLEKRVFALHFVEGLDFGLVLDVLNSNGRVNGVEDVANAVSQLREKLDPRCFKKLEYDRYARALGLESGRVFEYLLRSRLDNAGRVRAQATDHGLLEEERQRGLDRLAALRETLSPEDQELLYLRFDRCWTAKQIAGDLHSGGVRKVYRAIDRALSRLRLEFTREEAYGALPSVGTRTSVSKNACESDG